ncbi:VPLPA-CTERM sorting domain-containing protein [Tropicimonas sp. IMCC34043]|uniref:VPLPA-CTERM sorting domain-containing protein n=1 Tax=Tropicimonas sp. IMCC34043 TaxID=2248760 RepID=UPI000E2425AE|nr:VPLPA-CTERM sorting domain-containing protein [Tropicimonas sp. IMCC34043]
MKTQISALCAFLAIAPCSASALAIGSLDASRSYGGSFLEGSDLADLKSMILADGHTVVAPVATLTASYLSGLDAVFIGVTSSDFETNGAASAEEALALANFVSGGGIALILGENGQFDANTNTWLAPFGLALASNQYLWGGTWETSVDPLLSGGVSGSDLGYYSGSTFASGSYDIYATLNGDAAVVGKAFGSGHVYATGDGDFLYLNDATSGYSQTFILNALTAASVPAVPLPAGLPLALGGFGVLALTRRRQRSA